MLRTERPGDMLPVYELVSAAFGRSDEAELVNRLREERILISATGPKGHVLKIRPPLVFSAENVTFFLDRLEAVLRAG